MRSIALPGIQLHVSRFVFGTGSLHHLSRAAAQRLLEAALSHGFTHFDTAPSYGLGLCETWLGEVLAGDPSVGVTTKVGLYARIPVATRPGMLALKAGGRIVPGLSRAYADWTVERAKQSLARSRRRLRRTRIDLLMLHEPLAGSIATDEWSRFVEAEGDGIGAVGAAGEAAGVAAMLDQAPALVKIVQTRDSLERREADAVAATGKLGLTYGYLSHGCGDARAVLEAAVRQRPDCAILVSTRRAERLPLFAEIGAL
jgi:D-threo-aldose 1-dehydrogenase